VEDVVAGSDTRHDASVPARDDLLDIRSTASQIVARNVSAVETLDIWYARLHAVHATTNCVAWWNEEQAYETARALDDEIARTGPVGLLHGVPFTAKDWIEAKGMPCTGGVTALRDRRPERDASVIERMRAAGAVLMAKTAVQVESELFGPVFNPVDRSRSPGASSSGEAAAVAGGGSPGGIGSDSGGSIRVPAAWCGACGLKPTAGRVPATGHFPRVGARSDGRSQIGPIGRTVADLAAMLEVIAGPDGIDAGCAPVALDLAPPPSSQLRVGWSFGEGAWRAAPAIEAAVTRALGVLESGGAELIGEHPLQLDLALDVTRRYWRRRELTGADSQQQLEDWDRYRFRMQTAMNVDVILMPATTDLAPAHRAMSEDDFVFTLPASLTGWPAAVVPVPTTSPLPGAVQVVAGMWRDDVALSAAAAIEAGVRAP
jgi:amidase